MVGFRVFSQGTADRRRKIGNIFANFSLMDQGLFTLIHVLDRIFDGETPKSSSIL